MFLKAKPPVARYRRSDQETMPLLSPGRSRDPELPQEHGSPPAVLLAKGPAAQLIFRGNCATVQLPPFFFESGRQE